MDPHAKVGVSADRRKQTVVSVLECDHCGGAAIESVDDLFTDGDGGDCLTCGMPGHVFVEDDEEDATAWWRVSDDENARCREADCDECREGERKPL